MNLTTQEAQVACFQNVAAQLEPGGCFVIEVMVPELRKLPRARRGAVPRQPAAVGLRRLRHRHAGDELHTTSTVHGGQGEYRSIPFRYVWPAELDLMAQLAGLRLRERWRGWHRQPFTSDSQQHVSIWEKP